MLSSGPGAGIRRSAAPLHMRSVPPALSLGRVVEHLADVCGVLVRLCAGGWHPHQAGVHHRHLRGPPAAQPLAGGPAGGFRGFCRHCSPDRSPVFACFCHAAVCITAPPDPDGISAFAIVWEHRKLGLARRLPAESANSTRSCLLLSAPTQENANRLKAFKTNLVVFPRRSKKPKAGDASAEELQTVGFCITGVLYMYSTTCHADAAELLELNACTVFRV